MFIDLLVATAIGLIITTIFAAIFKRRGPWASMWLFLLLVLLASWAGGLWIAPFGPVVSDRYWAPSLVTGLLFALLMAAATPSYQVRHSSVENETAVTISLFFWMLLLGLATIILIAYL